MKFCLSIPTMQVPWTKKAETINDLEDVLETLICSFAIIYQWLNSWFLIHLLTLLYQLMNPLFLIFPIYRLMNTLFFHLFTHPDLLTNESIVLHMFTHPDLSTNEPSILNLFTHSDLSTNETTGLHLFTHPNLSINEPTVLLDADFSINILRKEYQIQSLHWNCWQSSTYQYSHLKWKTIESCSISWKTTNTWKQNTRRNLMRAEKIAAFFGHCTLIHRLHIH